jgi:UDP-N-acetylglucosamine--N-acetylmuramyl-(pentapeptide) pyrophosphoryl-undecaprenol N-acetylglucosamine transferase
MTHASIVLTGGASAGHLAPLAAVAQALTRAHPDIALHAVCTDRPEDGAFLLRAGIPCTAIALPKRNAHLPLTLWRGYRRSLALLREKKPAVVFSKGGAVTLPVCLAARRLGIPVVLHESDAVMGRANRMMARMAGRVCLGFQPSPPTLLSRERARGNVAAQKGIVVTGNPVRMEVTEGSRTEGLKITGFSGERPVLLVYGGSQGAEAINRIVIDHLDALLAHADIVHLTGKGKSAGPQKKGYWHAEFAGAELPHLYAIATLAVSRAGAGSIGELAANGIPSVLIPLRGLAQDHQEFNAVRAAETGGCVRLEQTDAPQQIAPLITRLLTDRAGLAGMAAQMRTLHRPEAARHIAEILREYLA